MKIALLTTDNREHFKKYEAVSPFFGTAPTALLQGFSGMSEVEVHVVSCAQQPMQSPGKIADNIWFHSLHVPKIGWLRTGYQGCIRAVRKKLKEIQPNIVHGQGTERDCAISAVLSGFPNVVTLHGIMQEQAKLIKARPGSFYWFATHLERFALGRTLGVFCNSAYTESMVQRRARRTWRVPNAIRKEFFETRLPTISKTSKPILLNIGAISPRKRQLALLDMADELFQAGLSFEACFIGAVDPRDEYGAKFLRHVALADKRGFAKYLGEKELLQVIEKLDSASALIHIPSEEAFGLVVAEGLARNLKLFATNVGGIPDIADNVETAELFPLSDSISLVNAISRWIRSGIVRPLAAADDMRSRYQPKYVAKRHIDIYQEVLDTSS